MSRIRMMSLVISVSACDAKSEEELAACDPFARVEQPTELLAPFAAGRAVDATIYVVESDVPHERVFVSDAGSLRRVPVAGSGGGGDVWTYGVMDHEPPFTLEVTDVGELRMRLLLGVVQDEIGSEGEELELVGDEELAGLPVFDLPVENIVEYVATSDHGQTVAVLRAEYLEGEDPFRLFYGVDALIEREISSFGREQDGGTTTIVFDVDGADVTAFFPTPYAVDEPATLTLDGVTSELTLLDASSLDDAEFRCRDQ